MNLQSMIFTWLRKLPVVLGLLCFAAVVWFGGPLLPIGDWHPLDPVWIRVTLIAVAVALVGAFYLARYWRRRRAEKAIEQALKASGEKNDDSDVLSSRMTEALETLKRSSGKQIIPL